MAMILNEGLSYSFLDYISFSALGEKIYTVMNNEIKCINTDDGCIESVCNIPFDYMKAARQYRGVLCSENMLCVQNQKRAGIFIYDFNDCEGKEIEFGSIYEGGQIDHGIVDNNDWIFIISRYLDNITMVHKKSNQISTNVVKKTIVEELRKCGYEFRIVKYQDMFCTDDSLWINVSCNNVDIHIELSIPDFEVINLIDTKFGGYNFGVYQYGHWLFFHNKRDNGDALIKWNLSTKEIDKVYNIEGASKVRGDLFGSSEHIVLGMHDGRLFKYDFKTDSFKLIEREAYVSGRNTKTDELIIVDKEGFFLWDVTTNFRRYFLQSSLESFIKLI